MDVSGLRKSKPCAPDAARDVDEVEARAHITRGPFMSGEGDGKTIKAPCIFSLPGTTMVLHALGLWFIQLPYNAKTQEQPQRTGWNGF